MRHDRDRLLDILEAIERIENYARRGRNAFDRDELIQVWMVHHLQIIGEAVARLGKNVYAKHPAFPWREIVAMRNVLVHEYFGIDKDEVWATVVRDLPKLKRAVEQLLEEES